MRLRNFFGLAVLWMVAVLAFWAVVLAGGIWFVVTILRAMGVIS